MSQRKWTTIEHFGRTEGAPHNHYFEVQDHLSHTEFEHISYRSEESLVKHIGQTDCCWIFDNLKKKIIMFSGAIILYMMDGVSGKLWKPIIAGSV
jgi:hypothetical protein